MKNYAGPTRLTEQVLNEICFYYGIDTDYLSICSNIAINTETSEKYVLDVAGTKKIFIKRIPHYASNLVDLERRSRFVSHLNEQGFIVPRILTTKSKGFYCKIKDDIWQAYDYVEGDGFVPSIPAVIMTLERLAEMHNISRSFVISAGELDLDPKSLVSKIEVFSKILNKEGWDKKIATKLTSFAVNVARNIVRTIAIDPQDICIVHGDFSKNNILYIGEKPCAVVDFDNSSIGIRYRDLVEFILTTHYFKYKTKSTNYRDIIPPINKRFLDNHFEEIDAYLKASTNKNLNKRTINSILLLTYIELLLLGFLRLDFTLTLSNLNNFVGYVEGYFKAVQAA